MALKNTSGKVIEIDRVSSSAIVKLGNSNDCFCFILSKAFISSKNGSCVPSCDDLSLGDCVHFDAKKMLNPTSKTLSDKRKVEVTHKATKAWLPSVPNPRNALATSTKMKKKKSKGQTASEKAVQEDVGAISKTMVKKACAFMHGVIRSNGGTLTFEDLSTKFFSFPTNVQKVIGPNPNAFVKFVKNHSDRFKMTKSRDGVMLVDVSNTAPKIDPREAQVQGPSEAILWSWGKGIVVALGKTFGYIAKDPKDDNQLVSFDADSLVLNVEPRDADYLAEIRKGAAVCYVAYACRDLSDNRRAWKALVVWKPDAKAQEGLFNGPVRVVQGRVSCVLRAGGSVTLGRSSDIRVPFSSGVIMCRSLVHEATQMMSVGDEVSCVLREAMVAHLPCLVVECVWKTELFEERPSMASDLNPVTQDGTVYGSGKVSKLTPSGGFISHKDAVVSFRSGDLYVDGELTLPTKLEKGTTVFYYAMPPSERTSGEVCLKATLVWKGKKPKLPIPSAALPQQRSLNLLSKDSEVPCPGTTQVPVDTSPLSLDNKGGILVQVKDSEDYLNIVQDLHLRKQSKNTVAKVGGDLGQEENNKELLETRDTGTQTISTGDIITLRLHTS